MDLHTHTYFSDGLLSPEALVERAQSRELAAIAITDHDSVEGLPRARAAASAGLAIVPGIEISSALEGAELHVLGYYLDSEYPPLLESLRRFQTERRERTRQILVRLAELGIALGEEAVLASSGPGVVGRPHVAAALVEAGHAANFEEAFRRYLGARGSAYVPRPHFRPDEAIALIQAANGIAILAHPGPGLADRVIEQLVGAGLRGIEVWHPLHNPATIRRYRALARRLDLIETGGSDFHGQPRGADVGDLDVPAMVLERLKQVAGVAS